MSGLPKLLFGGGGGPSGAGDPLVDQAPNLTPGVGEGAPDPTPAPAPAAEPAIPALDDPAIQAAREKQRKPKGRAATVLTGSQGLLSSPFLARRVLLGA